MSPSQPPLPQPPPPTPPTPPPRRPPPPKAPSSASSSSSIKVPPPASQSEYTHYPKPPKNFRPEDLPRLGWRDVGMPKLSVEQYQAIAKYTGRTWASAAVAAIVGSTIGSYIYYRRQIKYLKDHPDASIV